MQIQGMKKAAIQLASDNEVMGLRVPKDYKRKEYVRDSELC